MNDSPHFMVTPCECGSPDCDRIIFWMIRPQMRTIEEEGEELLCPCVGFPVEHVQSLINELRDLAAEKGVQVR